MNPDEHQNSDPMEPSPWDEVPPKATPFVVDNNTEVLYSDSDTAAPSEAIASDFWSSSVEPLSTPLEPAASDSTGIPITLSLGGPTATTSSSPTVSPSEPSTPAPTDELSSLRQQKQQLEREIADLQVTANRLMRDQLSELQAKMTQLIESNINELEQRRQTLQLSVEQLERRQERIKAEMRKTFAGTSQDLAIRVQGFKDYLVGSLQDLVTAAEEIKLSVPTAPPPEARRPGPGREPERPATAGVPKFAEDAFEVQSKQIRRLLDQYRTQPDYYGPPWQLRRTFEPIHAERVSNWFFTQGGRGAIRTMGSRLQNILVASAIASVLYEMNGDRLRLLILADSPERLGEWRRGLQDCLGISRSDFGTDQGVMLFDAPEPLAQRADRLMKQKQLPLIIVDESEEVISLSLLQFPLWLAFAPDPNNPVLY
ncbi:MAG TPA: DUF3086 domain-containing protein [Synechococcales cyanobacterium M55_K2018_004]|nr:DUF3086 domain-containing protein [Synechococcales cyanobacterium M55_K2018_004]